KGFLQQHRVRLTRALWLGTSEVTVGQFRKFVSETGYVTEGERDGKGGHGRDASGQWGIFPEFTWRHPGFVQSDDHPVVQVSWNDAAAFCEWLGRKEGKTYRLPTGAECEYACRAGSTTRWSFGDEQSDLGNYSWWSGNSEGHTHAVCQKIANAWGFYDMHGNVWEWCMDWYGVYPSGAVTDPQGPAIGSGRVARGGGSWNHDAANCRSAGCYAIVPTSRASYLGFRLALSPSGVRPEAAEDK
ncbi:MAG: formylglycine-generating enzyme family protein, partial [Planctomycetes bacterium]|nr:formylglycine-generating enzyme family protein [Planctomycetota bacterium]